MKADGRAVRAQFYLPDAAREGAVKQDVYLVVAVVRVFLAVDDAAEAIPLARDAHRLSERHGAEPVAARRDEGDKHLRGPVVPDFEFVVGLVALGYLPTECVRLAGR